MNIKKFLREFCCEHNYYTVDIVNTLDILNRDEDKLKSEYDPSLVEMLLTMARNYDLPCGWNYNILTIYRTSICCKCGKIECIAETRCLEDIHEYLTMKQQHLDNERRAIEKYKEITK